MSLGLKIWEEVLEENLLCLLSSSSLLRFFSLSADDAKFLLPIIEQVEMI
jgi:hypothetical protein